MERPRLFERLDAAREQRVTVVSAPAGAGKTTLVSGYLRARKMRSLWYYTDPGDAEPATFFHYLAQAVDHMVPSGEPLPRYGIEYALGLDVFARRFFEAMFVRLGRETTLVLDDYQRIPDDAPLTAILPAGLEAAPHSHRVFILSREKAPATLVRLRAARELAELLWPELKFTVDESIQLLRVLGVDEKRVENLQVAVKAVDGWAAALILMAGSLATGGDGRKIGGEARQVVFDYFAAEIFDGLEQRERQLLLTSSLLSSFTPEIAASLSGQEQATLLLESLAGSHLLVTDHRADPPSYRLHPLFRDFLRERLEASGQGTVELHRRAASLLDTVGREDEAMDLLLSAGALDDAANLISKHAAEILGRGRFQTLAGWLARLPADFVNGNPYLIFWQANTVLPTAPAEARRLFERSFNGFRQAGDRLGLVLSWCGAAEAMLHELNFSVARNWIQTLFEALGSEEGYPSAELEERVVLDMFSISALGPVDEETEQVRERAREIFFNDGMSNPSQRLMSGIYLAAHYAWRGHISEARLVTERLATLARAAPELELMALTVEATQSMRALLSGNTEECVAHAKKGISMAAASGIHVWTAQLACQALTAAVGKRDDALVEQFGNMAGEMVHQARAADRAVYHTAVSWLNRRQGNLQEAVIRARRSLDDIVGTAFLPMEGHSVLTLAEALHAAGEVEEATVQLDRGFELAKQLKSDFLLCSVHLLRAHFALEQQQTDVALEAVGEALRRAPYGGINLYAIWDDAIVSRLCRLAIAEGVEEEQAIALIRSRGLLPTDDIEQYPDAWPWELQIWTLGGFEIHREGQPLELGSRPPRRIIALLQMLVTGGTRGLTREWVCDNLWPDAQGDAAGSALTTSLQRLRRLVGRAAVRLEGNRLFLDPRRCWVDSWQFKRLAERAQDRRWQEWQQTARRAVATYHGDFLASESEPWTIAHRKQLGALYRRCVNELAAEHERGDRWGEAIALYEQGLQADETVEAFYQGLIRSHTQLRRRSDAMAAYERCSAVLEKKLGLSPSKDTQALYQRALSTG